MNNNNFASSRLILMASAMLFLLLIGMVWASQPVTTVAAGITPTSTPDSGGGGGSDDDDDDGGSMPCPPGEIVGIVSDQCSGQPVGAVQVLINGETVTTDGTGHYSRSGLAPGTYNISVQVAGEWLPDATTLTLSQCGETGTINLNYNSCPVPPTPTPDAAAFFLPETGHNNSVSPSVPRVFPILLLSGLILVTVGLLFYKGRR